MHRQVSFATATLAFAAGISPGTNRARRGLTRRRPYERLTRLDLRAGDAIPLPQNFSDPTASTVTLTSSPTMSGLPWTYQVPVQMYAMGGGSVAGTAKAGSMGAAGKMLTALAAADKDIGHPQAQIAISTATDNAIPVIAAPSSPNGPTGFACRAPTSSRPSF